MIQVTTHKKVWLTASVGVVLLACSGGGVVAQDAELEARFQEGMRALEEDRPRSAIRAFSTILDAQPELHRARLELALAYYRSMRYQEAEQLAKKVLDDPKTPPEVRVTILAFLAQVKRDSERLGVKHDLTPFVAAGFMHDSNVNVGPSSDAIRIGDVNLNLAPGSTGRSDNAYVFNAGVDYLFQQGKHIEVGEQTGMLMWQAGASVYKREYNRTGEFDLDVATLSGGPALLVLRHWRAALEFQSDYLRLGGGALGWFNSVTPSFTWQFKNGEVSWDAIYTNRSYHRNIDSGREGNYAATGLTLGRYMDNRKVALTAGARVINFWADEDEFGYFAGQVNAGVNAQSWHNGNVYARVRISDFNYDGRDSLSNITRDEQEYRTTLGFTHEYKDQGDLLKNWVVSGFWEWTENDSNIGGLYSYSRYQTMLMLSRSF